MVRLHSPQVLIVILVAVLGIGGYFVYTNYLNNQTTVTSVPETPTDSTFVQVTPTETANPDLIGANWKTYTSSDQQFSLQYPGNWTYKESSTKIGLPPNLTKAFQKTTIQFKIDNSGSDRTIILSLISDPILLNIDKEKIIRENLFAQTTPRIKNINIGYLNASEVTHTGCPSHISECKAIVFKKEATVYLMEPDYDDTDSEGYEQRLEIVYQILSTFKFTQ